MRLSDDVDDVPRNMGHASLAYNKSAVLANLMNALPFSSYYIIYNV